MTLKTSTLTVPIPQKVLRDNVERHKGNDVMVVKATKEIPQGRLLRCKKEVTDTGEASTDRKEHIQELEQLDAFLEKALQEQNLRFRSAFPHLIAQKL